MVSKSKNIEIEAFHYQPQNIPRADPNAVLRVAAYTRVSTLSETQEDSFETQCAYYEARIAADPGMVLVGVYGDQGVSGLSTRGRTELARMLRDCQDGKIDLVLTRSVSRLSRNIAECVETVNTLKALGIPVCFEKEGLTSTAPGCEMFFHVLATLAQEESGSLSRRVTWALARKAELGDPARRCPYGYRKNPEPQNPANIWIIDAQEAARVRKAFSLAADICPYDAILQELNLLEAAEGTDVVWTHRRLYRMLRSEVYRGDVLTHKTYGVDYVTRKRAVNRGQRTQYYIHAHHEPMVPVALFDRVQGVMDAGLLHSAAHKLRASYQENAARWQHEENAQPSRDGRRTGKSQKNIVQIQIPAEQEKPYEQEPNK